MRVLLLMIPRKEESSLYSRKKINRIRGMRARLSWLAIKLAESLQQRKTPSQIASEKNKEYYPPPQGRIYKLKTKSQSGSPHQHSSL